MARRLLTAVAALAVAAAFPACDDEAGGSGTARGDGASSNRMTGELCRAAELAREGDAAGAGAGFADVHTSLHELADRLGADEAGRRADAARLLEAKQRVEAGLEAGESPEQLTGDLRTLAGVVGDVTGEPVPERCG